MSDIEVSQIEVELVTLVYMATQLDKADQRPLIASIQSALLEIVKKIIGDDIDTQALVQAREREQAKHAFTVNETKQAQRLKLCEMFGIEIPKMSHRELREWLKELR